MRTSVSAETVARDAADAIKAARKRPGQIATLILPADTAWNEASQIGKIAEPAAPGVPSDAAIDAAAKALKSGVPTMLFLGDAALRETPCSRPEKLRREQDVPSMPRSRTNG